MSSSIINGSTIANLPWEEKPANHLEPVWRYSRNPVIQRDHIPRSNSIFNSAVVAFKDGFAGIFRCDDKARRMNIHRGLSRNGLYWDIDPQPIRFQAAEPGQPASDYKYDPRLLRIQDRYYLSWCNGYHGPTIGLGYTDDFEEFIQLENAFLPYNRNGVLFPRKIKGCYAMLSRPSDTGHTPFGDIFYSQSPDLKYWGGHRWVMGLAPFTESAWQSTKIGAGPVPIETTAGWLCLYHGVLNSCNGFVYSMGAALLDLEEPWKVLYRTRPYLLSPQKTYECLGDVPNVVFPCAALVDAPTGRMAIYYGGADTVTALAFSQVEELISFVKENSL